MAEVDRLGALQVGVAGHRPVAVALGQLEQALHRRARPARSPAASAPARPSPRRWRPGRCGSGRCAACRRAGRSPRRAAARSPCGCPRRPRRTRSRARRSARATRSSPAIDLLQLLLVEDADPRRAAGVRLRLVDVVGRQPPVELDRAVEPPEARVGVFAEAGHQRRDSRESLAHPLDLGLAHRREEGKRQRAGRGRFGDRELALAVAELAQVREEVDAGQVGLGGDAALGEPGDRPRRGRLPSAQADRRRRTSCAAPRRGRRSAPRPPRSRPAPPRRATATAARRSSIASSFSSWATPSAAARSESR